MSDFLSNLLSRQNPQALSAREDRLRPRPRSRFEQAPLPSLGVPAETEPGPGWVDPQPAGRLRQPAMPPPAAPLVHDQLAEREEASRPSPERPVQAAPQPQQPPATTLRVDRVVVPRQVQPVPEALPHGPRAVEAAIQARPALVAHPQHRGRLDLEAANPPRERPTPDSASERVQPARNNRNPEGSSGRVHMQPLERPGQSQPPRSERQARGQPEQPVIHVSIGRVEVRAVQAGQGRPAGNETTRKPTGVMPLEEYLRKRSGGDR